jgi:uncharacterized protein (TIGR00369 family)
MPPELLRQIVEDMIPFHKFLGVKVDRVERGRIRLRVPFREEFIGNPLRRAMHGGVISMLADAAGGFAISTALDGTSQTLATIDLRVDYLRPGHPEALVAEATVVRTGSRVGVADVRLFHPSSESTTIATGKGVYAIKKLKHPRAGSASE